MTDKITTSIIHHFSNIQDPRVNRQKKHPLQDIFFITLCAVICGADNWVAIEEFGEAKEEWFTDLLGLENGIPSHDTFGDVFAVIDTEEFSECFSKWVADLATLTEGEVIAIDGKCLRRSIDKASNKAAIYMVSAWAQKNSLILGQVKVAEKSNEITAIPKLLSRLDIAGAVITMDAMGCQKKIAALIVEKKADYVLSLKGNQGNLHDDVRTYFESSLSPETASVTFDGGHGRVETRSVRVTDEIEWLKENYSWNGLKSIIAVTGKREIKDKVTEETRYFISSLSADNPKQLEYAIRAHWAVENNLHWVLDMAFDEDSNRTRQGYSASNEQWTHFAPHARRGTVAMNAINILPLYHGTLCHDHWKPYYKYDCTHSLCNAHHLRELNRAWEQDGQVWAHEMKQLLEKINSAVNDAGGALINKEAKRWKDQYRELLKEAQTECPPPDKPEKTTRGRVKRSKARNLLERLIDYEEDVLRFMTVAYVPFTNNAAESSIRMTKVHQKISGCFRSMEGAEMFCRIRGYLTTCRKQGISATQAMTLVFEKKSPGFMS